MADEFALAAYHAVKFGASQDEDELSAVLAIISTLKPQVIVEIGCDQGGTLYAWRQICPQVYGITLPDNSYATGGTGQPVDAHGAVVHLGDSHDPQSLGWLKGELAGQRVDALVIDGDHTVQGASRDLSAYGPLVRPGGLILMHDIRPTADERAQVWKLWPHLARRYATTEVSIYTLSYGWGIIHVTAEDRF
jgi:hypothetical protein